jgi:anaerobic magnesium-protoporphyrin IX monomethyl ester cyclase
LSASRTVLLVDLNNFARYPTLAIGYIAATLRHASFDVRVFAPLMVGIRGVARETPTTRFSLFAARINHRLATSSNDTVRVLRERWAKRRLSGIQRHQDEVLAGATEAIALAKPAAVLISTYLMYRDVCEAICAQCEKLGIPVLIGGPYFAQPEVINSWTSIAGLSGLIAGEVELRLPKIVDCAIAGDDLSVHEGVVCTGPGGQFRGTIAAPLQSLDDVPFPDYSDFPWSTYPNTILPIITGRGCGWGVCSFCSDVTSTAGRTFRSRTAENVLREVAGHYAKYASCNYVFTDLKLNSDPTVWRSLIHGMQSASPGARWIGAVHAGTEADNGLSAVDLRDAARSGCVRLTTGLESGSQRVIDLMKKGVRLETVKALLANATSSGISMRCTMVLGHPGETAEDVHQSAELLAEQASCIERVSLNRLSIISGTTLHRSLRDKPDRFKGFEIVSEEASQAAVTHRNAVLLSRDHQSATMRLLAAVHRINSRPLAASAREFEGVM